MFGDDTPFFGDHGEVPRKLWSSERDAPFRECMVCNRALGPGDCYEIQKAFNRREAVFEIVVCMECGLALATEYSRESIEAIAAFIQQHLDFSRPPEVCTFCGAAMAGAPSQSLSAVCRGERLIMPLMGMCADCEERLQDCLSEKTRGAHDDFINRTVPGVPADLDLAPVLFL
ncbi:MAG TPA: hypothetical protein DCM87_02515 [Planctomycetes bacterium]|nr:hypothetical protein [Planctomycetota bacterium]